MTLGVRQVRQRTVIGGGILLAAMIGRRFLTLTVDGGPKDRLPTDVIPGARWNPP